MVFRRRVGRHARRGPATAPARPSTVAVDAPAPAPVAPAPVAPPPAATPTAAADSGVVWLGFADASGLTLAAADPAALALRAVADAMLRGR